MAKKKRKKYPRLPNSFGTIRYLGDNRANPYAVHPPAKLGEDLGDYQRPKALCYVSDWYVGFAVLNAFHAGTYKAGDELLFAKYKMLDDQELDALARRMLADYSAHSHSELVQNAGKKTFADVYELYYEWKYGDNAPKKLSESSMNSTKASYKHFSDLHHKVFEKITHQELQDAIIKCQTKSATKENMISLAHQMYEYAILHDIADRDYSEKLSTGNAEEDEQGVPFTEDELKLLWKHKEDPIIELVLIMCYSGYRISAYKKMEVHMDEWFFYGGVKSKTNVNPKRIVPIHSGIRELVTTRISRYGCMLPITPDHFRKSMYAKLDEIGIERHTPHDCRHTFSWLAEKYHVPENDRKRLLGHQFADVTNKVYGHRSIEDLRQSIECIVVLEDY